ncbi:MAG: family 4 glycosyl hydrolase, partial [Anaerolineae bacterium]
MTKIVIIGAGSGFGSRLSVDIMSREPLQDATLALCDIHPGRLAQVTSYVRRTAEKYNLPTKVVASTDRRELLADADFVITSVAVGGGAYYGEPYRSEIEIPQKYGIYQTVADTIGVGGIFRFLRTGPVQHLFFRDMEDVCPDAYVLNHTNPMAMLTWLHSTDSSVRNVGLCHSVQGTTQELAAIAGVPYVEMSHFVAGINHQAWVLELNRGKEDLYPRIWEALDDPEVVAKDPVRFEMMRYFGLFVTESSRHNAEYLPYFMQTEELRKRFNITPRQVPMAPSRVREWQADGMGAEAPAGELH